MCEGNPAPDPASHRSAVRAFVLRLIGNEALADDLTQEAYVRAQKTEANSRVRLHRGRAALREMLENGCVLRPGDSIPCERKPGSRAVRPAGGHHRNR